MDNITNAQAPCTPAYGFLGHGLEIKETQREANQY